MAEKRNKGAGYSICPHDAHRAAPEPRINGATVKAESGPEHILLVENDDVVPEFVENQLLGLAYPVITAAEAAIALRPDLKVLYTSGYTQHAIVHHGRLDPGVQLLSKPYRRYDLALKLRSVLGSE